MKSTLYPAQELKRLTFAWALKLRVNPKFVRVQAMTRKWGSCTSGRVISLASDLIDEDRAFQNYVIVHELLHLKYSSHGRVFKSVLSAHVPGWQRLEPRRVR